MDIVERLRTTYPELTGDEYWMAIYADRMAAADEIERLRHLLAAKIERVAAEDVRLYGSGFALAK